MPEASYTAVALIMRYFFCASVLYILFRLVWQSVQEYQEIRRVKSQIEGTYTHSLVFSDPVELRGLRYVLLKENTIGKGKKCSIRLSYKGIKKRHAVIYQSGESIWFSTRKKRGVYINGTPIERRQKELTNGDMVEICGVRFEYLLHGKEQADV